MVFCSVTVTKKPRRQPRLNNRGALRTGGIRRRTNRVVRISTLAQTRFTSRRLSLLFENTLVRIHLLSCLTLSSSPPVFLWGFGGVFTRRRRASSKGTGLWPVSRIETLVFSTWSSLSWVLVMIKTDDIVDLALGHKTTELIIATVDRRIAFRIGGCSSINVILSQETLLHLRQEHPDIKTSDYVLIPDIIDRGLILIDNARPLFAIFMYQMRNSHERYKVVIKSNTYRTKLYLRSFHRARKGLTKSILKHSYILRRHIG